MAEVRFPLNIDNTMRSNWAKCPKIAHWKFERGLNTQEGNENLVSGGAFASGIEVARKLFYGVNATQVIAEREGIDALYRAYGNFKPPSGSNKSVDRMAGALLHYTDKYPFKDDEYKPLVLDGKLMVEVSFNHEIPILHPDGGYDLSYCGRFDMLATDKNGDLWVVDEKTTGSLGPKWSNQWLLDGQMTGYIWGAQLLTGRPIKGAVVNGVAILKNGYDTMRCQTFRQDWEIAQWYRQMLKDVEEWKVAFKQHNHNQVFNHICAMYNNPCEYVKLCKSRNPERLEESYVVRFWNPLERDAK